MYRYVQVPLTPLVANNGPLSYTPGSNNNNNNDNNTAIIMIMIILQ